MKILFFKTKYLCYESNTVFINEMTKALQKKGVEVEVCEVLDEATAADTLEQYRGKHYDACIDFNTVTPRAVFEDGTPFLDTVDAPFFNYIVDHPFYHHPIINLPLKNYHILCLDENHVTYIKEHYPHIKSVHFLPLGAMKGLIDLPFEKKQIDLLFTGTYYMTDDVYMKQIKQRPIQEQKDMEDIIEIMLSNPYLTVEESFTRILKDSGREVDASTFAKMLNRYYNAEFYVRAHNRNMMVETVLKAGIPLTVIGNGWELYKSPYTKYLSIREPVSYSLSLEMILHAKMLLNILPNFKAGIHDRVLSAMINRTVSITDSSTFLKREFVDGKDIVFYQLDNMDSLPERIMELQNNQNLAYEISQNGYQKATDKFTWDSRIDEFIKMLGNI